MRSIVHDLEQMLHEAEGRRDSLIKRITDLGHDLDSTHEEIQALQVILAKRFKRELIDGSYEPALVPRVDASISIIDTTFGKVELHEALTVERTRVTQYHSPMRPKSSPMDHYFGGARVKEGVRQLREAVMIAINDGCVDIISVRSAVKVLIPDATNVQIGKGIGGMIRVGLMREDGGKYTWIGE